MTTDPRALAARGTEIYERKFKTEYEVKYPGQFVVIDIQREEATVSSNPEEAVRGARLKNPVGIFHLIRVGHSGVYRVSYSSLGADSGDWIFGR